MSLNYGSLNNLQMGYDATGNITSKSDVAGGASWTYDVNRIHAVTQAGSSGLQYHYDADGNMTSRNGSIIQWASFDHPNSIVSGSEEVDFSYNHNHERWKAVYTGPTGIETTYFVGDLMEEVIAASDRDYRQYIYAGSIKVAVYSRKLSGTNTLHYIREDHLGGVAAILNADGSSYVKESFTAFGSRRSSCIWNGPPTAGNQALISSVSRRGFTFQSALGAMGLNDMNGRIEDSVLGRFLSADPMVSHPGLTQSYNRYSYVENRPLTFVDPSGYDDDTNFPLKRDGAGAGDIADNMAEVDVQGTQEDWSWVLQLQLLTNAINDANSKNQSSEPIAEVKVTASKAKQPSTAVPCQFGTNCFLPPQGNPNSPPELPCTDPSCTQTVSGSPLFDVNYWFPSPVVYELPFLSPYPLGPIRGPLAFPLWQLPSSIPGLCYASRANNPSLQRNVVTGGTLGFLTFGTIGAVVTLNIVGFPEVELAEGGTALAGGGAWLLEASVAEPAGSMAIGGLSAGAYGAPLFGAVGYLATSPTCP